LSRETQKDGRDTTTFTMTAPDQIGRCDRSEILPALMLGEGLVKREAKEDQRLRRHQAGNEVNARSQRSATRGSAETPSHRLVASKQQRVDDPWQSSDCS
jgi:hypothetical protein